jgi:acetyl-CoA carboxylase alpha subunit
MRRNVAFERLWQELVESLIPKNATAANKDPAQVLGDMRRYLEDKVDSMRQQKDEELE